VAKVFLDYDQAELDRQYEQRGWVPNADQILARWDAAGEAVRARLGAPQVHAYGSGAVEKLELHVPERKPAPLHVHVHGGAWRRLSARQSAFPAPLFVGAGAAYCALDFALLPASTLAEMVAQVARAFEWLHAHAARLGCDPAAIHVSGHSSGAHLAACALERTRVAASALLVSGIYDLLPVRLSARNDYVRLDERLEAELSPIRHVERLACPVFLAWAERDAAEFQRQSREFAAALEKAGRLAGTHVAPGQNHFEVIEQLGVADSALARAALGAMGLS
jgi:arylformamidase